MGDGYWERDWAGGMPCWSLHWKGMRARAWRTYGSHNSHVVARMRFSWEVSGFGQNHQHHGGTAPTLRQAKACAQAVLGVLVKEKVRHGRE